MLYTTETVSQGEQQILNEAAAETLDNYSKGKNLSMKVMDLLRQLLFENMKSSVSEEEIEYIVETECETRRLDPDEVMSHFTAIMQKG